MAKITHGLHGTRQYRTWTNMLTRCNNPKSENYPNYGGRGIGVCEKWQSFDGFWEDMGDTYKENLWLDRKNSNEGYSKENCRWIPMIEQMNNKRGSRLITIQGSTRTVAEWCRLTGLGKGTLKNRLDTGWPVEEALGFKPHKRRVLRSAKGEMNGNSRLKEKEVREIRKLCEREKPNPEQIAVLFGISEHLVRAIKYRKVWKHLQ